MTELRPLTPRQARFAEQYLIDLNATKAAIRAGYSFRSAREAGSVQLKKPHIRAAIEKEYQKRAERTEITQDKVLKELARLAFSDMSAFAKWGEAKGVVLRDSDELNEDETRAVMELGQTTTKDGGSLRFKLHNKEKALELLGKHLGMFVDRIDLGGGIEIRVELPTDMRGAARE